jgi:flagella basal body P-ring formation protein FlgA
MKKQILRPRALFTPFACFACFTVTLTSAWANASVNEAHAHLLNEARQWVSENEGLRAEEINFLPLDSRLELEHCSEPYAIDLPFGNAQTLRVRCPSSGQQVFLRRARNVNERLSKEGKTKPGASTHISYGDPVLRSDTQLSKQPITRPSLPTRVTPASSNIQFEAKVLVAASNLNSGQPLTATMFRQETIQLNQSPKQFYSEFDGLEFLELVRPVKAGSPIRKRDLKKSTLVRKGEPVQHVISSVTGLTLSVKLEAAENGFAGEQIRLKNPESGKTVMGRVTGRNKTKSL